MKKLFIFDIMILIMAWGLTAVTVVSLVTAPKEEVMAIAILGAVLIGGLIMIGAFSIKKMQLDYEINAELLKSIAKDQELYHDQFYSSEHTSKKEKRLARIDEEHHDQFYSIIMS